MFTSAALFSSITGQIQTVCLHTVYLWFILEVQTIHPNEMNRHSNNKQYMAEKKKAI